MQNVAVKVVVTPVLIGAASLAGRRWGHHIGGWLVALPLTSGPVAFFLATDHGAEFAAQAAVGMLAGTSSQVAVALTYRALAGRGWVRAFGGSCAAFAATTAGLTWLNWSAIPTFALVLVTFGIGATVTRRSHEVSATDGLAKPARWDIPVRMLAATAVVLTITALAPVIGPRLAGLLSPFPVFGMVLALFTHRTHGSRGAVAVFDGLVLGLAAPAVFFLLIALTLPVLGLPAFLLAAVAALVTQALTLFAMPSSES
jgi:hypothetical protein